MTLLLLATCGWTGGGGWDRMANDPVPNVGTIIKQETFQLALCRPRLASSSLLQESKPPRPRPRPILLPNVRNSTNEVTAVEGSKHRKVYPCQTFALPTRPFCSICANRKREINRGRPKNLCGPSNTPGSRHSVATSTSGRIYLSNVGGTTKKQQQPHRFGPSTVKFVVTVEQRLVQGGSARVRTK